MMLLGSPTSPYVRKVRLVLEEKGIAHDFMPDRPSAPGSRVPTYNPLGKVPVLVRDDGKAVYDSPVIVEYLDHLRQPRLIPEGFEERIEVKRWEALGDGIADATVAISHERRKPKPSQETDAWYEKQRLKIDRGLAVMSRDLGEREYCFGDRLSLADIATAFALGYMDHVLSDVDWRAAHPNLKRFAERFFKRESFVKTAPPKA
jgi:glutathione S-transferase